MPNGNYSNAHNDAPHAFIPAHGSNLKPSVPCPVPRSLAPTMAGSQPSVRPRAPVVRGASHHANGFVPVVPARVQGFLSVKPNLHPRPMGGYPGVASHPRGTSSLPHNANQRPMNRPQGYPGFTGANWHVPIVRQPVTPHQPPNGVKMRAPIV